MKKILSLVMALAMVLGCFAMAETTSILDADMDELLVLDRESSLNDWKANGCWLRRISPPISLRNTTWNSPACWLCRKMRRR